MNIYDILPFVGFIVFVLLVASPKNKKNIYEPSEEIAKEYMKAEKSNG